MGKTEHSELGLSYAKNMHIAILSNHGQSLKIYSSVFLFWVQNKI